MKNTLTGCLLLILSVTATSQNVGINADGSNADSNTMLEIKSTDNTSSSFGLKVKDSGGNEKMVVRSDGNVGIGTLTPETRLHILGGTRIESSSTVQLEWFNNTASANNKRWYLWAVGDDKLRFQGINDAGSGGGNVFDFVKSGNQIQSFQGLIGGNPWFTVDNSSARVGIGTSSPIDRLSNTTSAITDGASGRVVGNSIVWEASGAGYAQTIHNSDAVTTNAQGLLVKIDGTSSSNRLLTLNANGTNTFVATGEGKFGIGTDTPLNTLQVVGDMLLGSTATVPGYQNIWLRSGTAITGYNGVFEILPRTVPGSGVARHATYFQTAGSSGTTRHDVLIDGSVGIGTTATGNARGPVLAIGNATYGVPISSIADGVQLYAEDVSSSSELKVRDEAGNITTLSPHNFSIIPNGKSEELAWSFYSERDGKSINVDMTKMARLVEKMSAENLVYIQDKTTGKVSTANLESEMSKEEMEKKIFELEQELKEMKSMIHKLQKQSKR